MKIKELVDLKDTLDMQSMVTSCIKLFGSATTCDEVLAQIYDGKDLSKALELVDKLDLVQDLSREDIDVQEVIEMNEVEIDNNGDEIMKKQNKVVKVEELDMHIDNNGIDADVDTRVVTSDHGISKVENTLEYWMKNIKDDEIFDVPFKEVYTHLDNGAYPGTVVSVARFYGTTKTFENKVIPGGWRFVINVKMEPVYSKAEHRGWFLETLPIYMSPKAFLSYCEQMGWEFGDRKSMCGKAVNVMVDYDQVRKSKTYFLQGK